MNLVSRPIVLGGSMALALVSAAMAQPLPPVPVPAGNPITENKRLLGKILFWDEQLSATNTMSCGTCHIPGRGGTEPRDAVNPGPDGLLGTGDDKRASAGVVRSDSQFDYLRDPVFGLQPQITTRSAPSMIDAAFAPVLFWDGRAAGPFLDPVTGAVVLNGPVALENQAAGPPTSSAEMGHDGINWSEVASKLSRSRPLDFATSVPPDIAAAISGGVTYGDLFRRAFGDDQVTPARAIMAIATYERTLIANDTPFDRFNAGQTNALTAAQQRGLNAMGASSCRVCHAGPLFTDQSFRNIGLRPPAEDTGRQQVTNNTADRGKFKVPSLRNVGLKRTFMHNGQFTTLTDLIRFYVRAPGAAPQFTDNRDPVMLQVAAPPGAQVDIEDFLRNGLTDARVASQTFPFDRPTLTSERPELRNTNLGGGVPGSGNTVARVIADMPGKLGWEPFRVGVDGALAGATATLVASFNAPFGGSISPDRSLGTVTVGAGGLATIKTTLSPDKFTSAQPLYVQWLIQDPAAPGGIAKSEVVRIPMFCGLGGCPVVCTADVAGVGGTTGPDGLLTVDDIVQFLAAFFDGDIAAADKGSLGGINAPDGVLTVDDIVLFLSSFFSGCR